MIMAKAQQKKPEIPAGRLWPLTPSGAELSIEVFGATGEYSSGKTLLGLSIAPGVHPEGHAFVGKPRTLLLDFEKSAGTYGGTGCHRLDVPAEMQKLHGEKNYQPLDVFAWFVDLISKIQPGQFDVIMADPITDVEAGQLAFIRKNHDSYGLTHNQITKGGGLLWGAVKDDWKQRLLKIGAKCQTFFFTSHLRSEWQGDRPTGKREPKGKETLFELTSLYLWLERKADKDGNVPDRPSAIVLKQRLSDTLMTDDGELEIIQLMPPRLPVATVSAIRAYIAYPPNYGKLKAGEKVVAEECSEEEKARIALATAEAQKETEQFSLARLDRQIELKELARQQADAKPQPPDQTAQRQADKAKAAAEDAEAAQAKAEAEASLAKHQAEGKRLMAGNDAIPNAETRCTPEQIQRVGMLCTSLKMTPEFYRGNYLAKVNARKTSDLNRQQCTLLIDVLEKQLAKNSPGGPGSSTA